MTATLFDTDPRAVTISLATAVDGHGDPCDQCDDMDCFNEAEMYYTSLFAGPIIATGSLACLARLYRSDADFEAKTTIEVQR